MTEKKYITADLEKLPGLNNRNWQTEGLIFGLVASLGLSFIAALIAMRMSNITIQVLTIALVPPIGAFTGALFGRRWKYLMLRDSGRSRVSILRWLFRSIVDGAVAGILSFNIYVICILLIELFIRSIPSAGILLALVCSSILGAIVGAIMLGALGLPYALILAQDRRPYFILLLVFLSGPTTLMILRSIISA